MARCERRTSASTATTASIASPAAAAARGHDEARIGSRREHRHRLPDDDRATIRYRAARLRTSGPGSASTVDPHAPARLLARRVRRSSSQSVSRPGAETASVVGGLPGAKLGKLDPQRRRPALLEQAGADADMAESRRNQHKSRRERPRARHFEIVFASRLRRGKGTLSAAFGSGKPGYNNGQQAYVCARNAKETKGMCMRIKTPWLVLLAMLVASLALIGAGCGGDDDGGDAAGTDTNGRGRERGRRPDHHDQLGDGTAVARSGSGQRRHLLQHPAQHHGSARQARRRPESRPDRRLEDRDERGRQDRDVHPARRPEVDERRSGHRSGLRVLVEAHGLARARCRLRVPVLRDRRSARSTTAAIRRRTTAPPFATRWASRPSTTRPSRSR